jgi:hypothetical protein
MTSVMKTMRLRHALIHQESGELLADGIAICLLWPLKKGKYGKHMGIYGNLWQFMAIYGNFPYSYGNL